MYLALSAPLCNFNRDSLQWGCTDPCKHLHCQQAPSGWSMPAWRLFHKKYLGLWHLHWDYGCQSSKAPLNSLSADEFIYFEDINPLQLRGHRSVHAATGRSVCHDLAFPEMLGNLSETARSSALDQEANYNTDWLCMHTWFIWRWTAVLMGFVLCTNISWFASDH